MEPITFPCLGHRNLSSARFYWVHNPTTSRNPHAELERVPDLAQRPEEKLALNKLKAWYYLGSIFLKAQWGLILQTWTKMIFYVVGFVNPEPESLNLSGPSPNWAEKLKHFGLDPAQSSRNAETEDLKLSGWETMAGILLSSCMTWWDRFNVNFYKRFSSPDKPIFSLGAGLTQMKLPWNWMA